MNEAASLSSMPLACASIIIGLAMLVGGGESLVYGASRLARRFGMSPLVIGLTVVAFGTSVPELFVSVNASISGYPDIMVGNVIGSNIANVGLILGCCALLAPLSMALRAIWLELLLVTAGSVSLMVFSLVGYFPRILGGFFMVILMGYTLFIYRNSSNGSTKVKVVTGRLPIMLMFILAGLLLLAAGSTLFIQGAVDVARYFHVSELVIGLTLAAVGTSLPELASSLAALRQREKSMIIGNVVGSNMFNLFMVLGLTGLLLPFDLSTELLRRDLPIMTAFTLVLVPFLAGDGRTRRWQGALLLLGYGLYCVTLV